MTTIDPELVPGLADALTAHLPDGPLDVATVRAIDGRLRAAAQARTLAGADLAPAAPPRVIQRDGIGLRVHGPQPAADRSCLLWIHGGGMFLGSARTDDPFCADLAERLAVPVVAVDYRLAPEHPHPAPLHDCRTALAWCATRARGVVVAGGSAGGGLAAALCLLTRDEGGPAIAAAHLYYPMLDDRHTAPGVGGPADPPVWNRRLAGLAWKAYLGGRPADALAAPARAEDLRGLPATYIETGELDLFRDEDVDYAHRLAAAGVEVRLEVVPGAVHAFELIAPEAAISRAARDRRLRALAHDLKATPR
jgi:acetyl esterase/lipase